MKIALITGVTGQDGSYLTELLLSKGYEVHGLIRRSSSFNTDRIDHIYQDRHEADVDLQLHYGDMSDASALGSLIDRIAPDEIYHLAAQSHVRLSFDQPIYTADIVALGTLRLLEAVQRVRATTGREIRVYNAGSSEMFGSSPAPQHEGTRFAPRSPYAIGKVAAHHFATNYREAYGLFVTNGVLFNHESPRRGETFVTRKVTRAVGRIRFELQKDLYLGNLDGRRDWGYAGDYVEGMWRMLQHEVPDDFVLATGRSYTVREMVEAAFSYAELDWEEHVRFDERYLRPTEADHLEGDASKAETSLGWTPKVGFSELIRMMVDSDMALAEQERALVDGGHKPTPRGLATR